MTGRRLLRGAAFGLAFALALKLMHALPRHGAVALVLAVLLVALLRSRRT